MLRIGSFRRGIAGIVAIQAEAKIDLLEIISTGGSLCTRLGAVQGRQQQGSENGDDCNNHQQFNQRKSLHPLEGSFHVSLANVTRCAIAIEC